MAAVIWALLAILGVPIWLIVGALGGALWSRRRFRSQEGVFPLAMRRAGESSWPRMPVSGRLIRDILIVNRGIAMVRTEVYPIIDVRPVEVTVAPKRLDDSTTRLLGIAGQADLEVAVPHAVGGRLDQLALPSTP